MPFSPCAPHTQTKADWLAALVCVNFTVMYTRDLMSLLAIVVGMLLVLAAA
jgi:hypothetical protein